MMRFLIAFFMATTINASLLTMFHKDDSIIPLTGEVELKLRDEKTQGVLFDLLEQNRFTNVMPTNPLLRPNYTTEEIKEITSNVNFTSNWVIAELEKLTISPSDIFKSLQVFKHSNLTKELKMLNINETEFNSSLVRNNYDVIKTIDFAKAMNLVNITDVDMFTLVIPHVNGLKNVPLNVLLDLIPFNNRRRVVQGLLKPNHTDEPFSKVLDAFKQSLTKIKAVGTAISKRSFVSPLNTNEYIAAMENFEITLRTQNASYTASHVTFHQAGYMNATTARLESYTSVATDYKKPLKNCTYILKGKPYLIQNVTNHNGDVTFSVGNTNITEFSLGAPLVCKNRLYGITANVTNNIIRLITFKNIQQEGEGNYAKGNANMITQSMFMLPICFIFMLMLY